MLTMARNIALGLGMSTAEGSIQTNGTQPFTTFVWSVGYSLTGGDKLGGVIFAHIVLTVVSILFALATYFLVLRVFEQWHNGRSAALVVSALVFSSPQLLPHTMNFLETGLYLALGTFIVHQFYTLSTSTVLWTYKRYFATGALLGILFLIRIDSVFIILSVCLTCIYLGWLRHETLFSPYLPRVIVLGATSIVVASPWLIYNYIGFGSIMPISGQALSAQSFAPNLIVVPSTLLEYLMLSLPIPHRLQESTPIVVGSTCALISALGVAIYAFKRTENHSYKAMFFMGFTCLFCYITYYGLFFGAKHFVGRYLSITTPFLMLFATMLILTVLKKLPTQKRPVLLLAGAICLIITVSLNFRIYQRGIPHQHQQVVAWVKAHVPKESWVGAIQTGTLGYFHDRTINLDGKVNPMALKAKNGDAFCPESSNTPSKSNCLMDYIVQSEIDYLVDWQGIGTWNKLPPLDQYFTLTVNQEQPSLAAFVRNNIANK